MANYACKALLPTAIGLCGFCDSGTCDWGLGQEGSPWTLGQPVSLLGELTWGFAALRFRVSRV